MYQMTVRQAVISPATGGGGFGGPEYAPWWKPSLLLGPGAAKYPTPLEVPPASTGPLPPTLAVPPGTLPVYPGDVATPPVPPTQLPGDVVGPPLPPGGNGTQPPAQPPVSWWDARSDLEKGAVVLGAAAVLGGLAYVAFGKGMRPNRAAPRRATGEVITLKDGQRWGHTMPPKEYRTQGATRKSDYAWPDGYKYPLVFRRGDGTVNVAKSQRHVRSAASYFARYKHKYPPRVRREIASNINRAKKRFDVGGKPATP